MADKKISQLDLAAQINNDAVIPMSQENGGEQTTYKALITALGAKIAEGLTFSNLATTAKNLVGAINEIQAGGGGGGAAILIGTTTPSSSQGSNGNLYIKYTEGVGGADDTVDAIYVKLDGTWCEVTTDYADLLNKPSINNNTLSGNKTNNDLGIYGKTIEMSTTDTDKVADRIEALETASGHELLWTNTTHTSDFSAQTITPDTKGYMHFVIYTKAFKNNSILHGNYCIMGEQTQINNIGGATGGYYGNLEISTRIVTIATNSFTFTASGTSTNGATMSTTDDTHCIPYKIFGIK